MAGPIAILIRNPPKEFRVSAQMNIDGVSVEASAMARYDIFEEHEKLCDFVRQCANGDMSDAQDAATKLMDEMKFA